MSYLSSAPGDGISGNADANFTYPFTALSVVVVTHNLGKYPAVSVIDSANDTVTGDIVHNSINQLTITFNAPFTGTVICN